MSRPQARRLQRTRQRTWTQMQQQMRKAGLRPWSDAPALLHTVLTPLAMAFAVEGQRVATCVHLDGLSSLDDLDRVAVWSPGRLRSLLCAPCYQQLLADDQSALSLPVRRPCDACGQVAPGLATFTNAIDEPDALLLILGSFCPPCRREAGVA